MAPSAPLAPRPWRLIQTLGAPPNFNMALDEALLDIGGAPALRLYTWNPDTLSLGYFQKYADVPGTVDASHVVRRHHRWGGDSSPKTS